MRTLILSCNTGGGHNSCAAAIEEVFSRHGACDTADALSFISSGTSKLVSDFHVNVYRHAPALARVGYRGAEQLDALLHERERKSGIADSRSAAGTKKLLEFLTSGGYDTVLCTHPFAALMLTHLVKNGESSVKSGFIATDYTCSPSVSDSALDWYFIPDESLVNEFALAGIPREKLIASGIPVRSECSLPVNKADAKRALGLPENHLHLLMMCGSMGCGPLRELTDELSGRISPETELTVICGTNRELFEHLSRRFGNRERVHILGSASNVPEYLHSADLFLTKPGGLSTTEAAAARLPMVFVDAVAGCEEYNLRFFLSLGAAETAETPAELAALSCALIENRERLSAMAAAYPVREITPAERIYEVMAE